MVRSKDDPATEGVSQVDHACTAAEAQDLGKGGLHGEDEHLQHEERHAGRVPGGVAKISPAHFLTLYFWK